MAREYEDIMRRQGVLDMTTVSSQGMAGGLADAKEAARGDSPKAAQFYENEDQLANRRTHDLADLVIEESIRQSNRSGPRGAGRQSAPGAANDSGDQRYFRNRLQEKAGLVRQPTPEGERGRRDRSDQRRQKSRSGTPDRSPSRSRSGEGPRRQRRRRSPRGVDGGNN